LASHRVKFLTHLWCIKMQKMKMLPCYLNELLKFTLGLQKSSLRAAHSL
jgi:hypothetical protein